MDQKILVLGGVESIKYEEIARLVGLSIDYVPKATRLTAHKIRSYGAIVCLTAQVSHTMVSRVKRAAQKQRIPVFYLHQSGKTRFNCFLQDYCDRKCFLKQEVRQRVEKVDRANR